MSDEQGSGATGWIVFLLIFVVGNLITYNACGVYFIPIPRR
jgi:hypothetical protein